MYQQLTPKLLGQAIGVSESSLKRWSDEGLLNVSRTAGGHRRIDMQEAIRFIRESNQSVVRPEILRLPDLEAEGMQGNTPQNRREVFTQALMEGNAKTARGIVLDEYLSGKPLAQTCDELVTTAMCCIGDLWNHSEEGIFIEHRATDICVQAINQVRSLMLNISPKEGPISLGAAPAGDPYLLPTMIASAVLASEGWSATNIGPDTPWDVLARSAKAQSASLVWVSVSTAIPPKPLGKHIETLASSLSEHGCQLVIGGRELGTPSGQLPDNAVTLSSMIELAAYARGLRSRPVRGGAT